MVPRVGGAFFAISCVATVPIATLFLTHIARVSTGHCGQCAAEGSDTEASVHVYVSDPSASSSRPRPRRDDGAMESSSNPAAGFAPATASGSCGQECLAAAACCAQGALECSLQVSADACVGTTGMTSCWTSSSRSWYRIAGVSALRVPGSGNGSCRRAPAAGLAPLQVLQNGAHRDAPLQVDLYILAL